MSSDEQQVHSASRQDRREAVAEALGDPSPADNKNDEKSDKGQADRKQWDPVVVDTRIEKFESVPQRIRPYSPDTLCDGWSCGQMTVRMASVRGYLHRYNGVPRQDDVDLAFEAQTGAVVFAVADGLSSASYAHVGAHAACRAATDAILQDLASPGVTGPDWPRVINAAADAVTECAAQIRSQRPTSQDDTENLVATTLVAGYVRPSDDGLSGSLLQIGDSSAWVHRDGSYQAVLPVKESDYLVSSSVFPLPRIPETLNPVDVRLDVDSVLLIGTDGFGDPLGDGDGLVGQLFTKHIKTPPLPLEFAHLLDFSRETFDDDRTLIAIWPRHGEWKQH